MPSDFLTINVSKKGIQPSFSCSYVNLIDSDLSDFTDHVVDKNHVICWDQAKVLGTEEDRYKRWIKEAIEIRKRRGKTMNRDDGQYQFTHIFDEFLVPTGSKSPIGKQSGNPAVTKKSSVVARDQRQSLI